MRVYWEKIGVLGPIYRLVGQGFNDQEIANRLNITEVKVHGCIAWLLKFLNMPDRLDLVRHAFTTEHPARQVVEQKQEYVPVMSVAD
jgi:hypothetical protein